MSKTDTVVRDEDPVLRRALIAAVVGIITTQTAKWGLDLDAAQQRNLTELAVVAVPLAAGWWARRRAYSPATVQRLLMQRAGESPPVSALVVANPPVTVRQDPGWLRKWWPAWLAVLALGFAAPETVAIVAGGEGGTLSEQARQWLGTEDGGLTAGWVVLTTVLAAFSLWFPIHLLRRRDGSGFWPWERNDRPAAG